MREDNNSGDGVVVSPMPSSFEHHAYHIYYGELYYHPYILDVYLSFFGLNFVKHGH